MQTCIKTNKETDILKKPSESEQEYIARMEYERLKRLKELHFMKCSKCGMDLIAIDYKGIEMDKCSECEGICLDAGELEAVSKLEKFWLDKLFSVFSLE